MGAAEGFEWQGPGPVRFHCTIAGYEFPAIGEDYDANWLVVGIEAARGGQRWKAGVPCALTWEVAWLSAWFQGIAADRDVDNLFVFLEPELQIEYLGSSGAVRHIEVRLKHGLLPPGTAAPDDGADPCAVLRFALQDDTLRAAAQYLDGVLEQYPPRGEQGERAMRRLPGPAR